MVLTKDFQDKKILITGHTGFKGAWLAFWLSQRGAKIYGYALPEEYGVATYSALGISDLLTGECLDDLNKPGVFGSFFERTKPDLVFHLAAQALVRRSYTNPRETILSNIVGTMEVLEVLRRFPKIPAIIVTSDKCYENQETTIPYKETDAMGGYDIYSMSKGSCELMVAAYRRSFGLSIASARAGNVIGGGDFSEDRILPDCVRSIRKEQAVILRNPKSTRPWQHVLEPLSGYLTLGSKLLGAHAKEYCEGWNFGPESNACLTVAELVESFHYSYGAGQLVIDSSSSHPHEAKLLSLDIEKAKSRLGWKPVWNTKKAIEATAQWYKQFELAKNAPASMREISLEQIKTYERDF